LGVELRWSGVSYPLNYILPL